MKTRILTRRDVESLLGTLTMEKVVDAVEAAFAAHGSGETQMPPKVYLQFDAFDGDLRAMPSATGDKAGLKWVNSHPLNPERFGLPSVMGLFVLSDPETAFPRAVMDATALTAYRTGAAAAVASRHLAGPSPKTLGIIGCGVQARTLLDAHRVVFGRLEVRAADVSRSAAAAFAAEADGEVVGLEAAAGCDIVCTSTPVRSPIVRRAWLADGAHINAVGADAEGKQELDADVLTAARVVVDDRVQAAHSGEINVPIHEGQYAIDKVHGTLGEVVVGALEGRGDASVTVFDSTGLAVQDLFLAAELVRLADELGIGIEVDLVGVAPRS